jgi:hypothetical protein
MSTFTPGDKVSFINDKLNGTVKQVTGRGEVIVTLDDGFEIPVDTRQLILVKSATRKDEKPEEKYVTPRAELEEKLALGFVVEGQSAKVYFLNNTPYQLQYMIYNVSGVPRLIGQGGLEKATSVFLVSFQLSDAEKWKSIRLQTVRHNSQVPVIESVIDRTVKVRGASLLKETTDIPFLGRKGMLINILEAEDNPVPLKSVEASVKQEPVTAIEPVPEVVDLHTEAPEVSNAITAESILKMQLATFENCIEKGAAQKMEKIVFIHGVGNGVLKSAMQRILMRHKYVRRWEDADEKKFGYGATAVYLKTS